MNRDRPAQSHTERDNNLPMNTRIEWSLPRGQAPDWLFGAGATTSERVLSLAGGLFTAGLYGWYLVFAPLPWSWWQYLLAVLLAIDVGGGAVSNASNATKRQYFGSLPEPATATARLLHSAGGFASLHIHPLLIALVYPGGVWWWGAVWYLIQLGSVLLVRTAPLYLARPLAMLLFVGSMLLNSALGAPTGWVWFIPVFVAKLVLGHAVREEPYRPADAR